MSSQGRGNLRFKPPFKPDEPPEPLEPKSTLTNGLKSILVQRKGRGKQSKKVTQTKKLTWRPESELVEIQYFEWIEGERTNVKPDVVVNSNESSRILRSKSNWEKSLIVDEPIESCSKPIEQDEQDKQDQQDEEDEQDEQDEQEPYDSDIDGDLDSFSEDFDSDEDNMNDYEMQRLQNLAEMQNNEFFLKAKTRRIELNPPKTKAVSRRPAKG